MIPRDKLSLVKGFLTPVMVGPSEATGVMNAFADPAEIDMIEKGYACGYCCATFHTFQLECPICHRQTNVAGLREDTPAEWADYVKGRGPEAQGFTARDFDDAMKHVEADPDVDHVALSRLRPSRWGLGRPR